MAHGSDVPEPSEPVSEPHMTYCWYCGQETGTQVIIDNSGIGKYKGTWTLERCLMCHAMKMITFLDSDGKLHT